MAGLIELSVVIPIYRNEKSISELTERLLIHLHELRFEIIYVNDASPDGSLSILKKLSARFQAVKYLNLVSNIGQHKAILEGLKIAEGQKIVVLDGDLQDKPELIKSLYNLHKGQNEAVFILRKGMYQMRRKMLTSILLKRAGQVLSGLNYKAGSYFLIDALTLLKVLQLAQFCQNPYVTILVAASAENIRYFPAQREKSNRPSSYNFAKRLKAAYHMLSCCIQCKYAKSRISN